MVYKAESNAYLVLIPFLTIAPTIPFPSHLSPTPAPPAMFQRAVAVLFLKHSVPLHDYVLHLTVLFSLSFTPSSHNCLKVNGLFVFQGSIHMSPALPSHNTVLVRPRR